MPRSNQRCKKGMAGFVIFLLVAAIAAGFLFVVTNSGFQQKALKVKQTLRVTLDQDDYGTETLSFLQQTRNGLSYMSILGAAQSIPNDDIAVTRMEEALKKTSSSYYMVVRDENGKLLKGFGQTSRASTPSVTSNDVRELARQILSNTNIAPQKGGTCDEHLSQGDECKGRTGPYEIIEDVSNGQLPCVCSVACVCNRGGDTGRVQLKPLLLRALIDMSKKYKFTVNSVTGGSHDSDDSHHYMGRAADVNPDQDLSEFLYNYPGIYDLYGPVQYLQANGDTLCVDNTHKPARCISGHQGHIHFSVVDDGQVQSSSVTTTTSSSVDIPLPGGKTGTFEMGL